MSSVGDATPMSSVDDAATAVATEESTPSVEVEDPQDSEAAKEETEGMEEKKENQETEDAAPAEEAPAEETPTPAEKPQIVKDAEEAVKSDPWDSESWIEILEWIKKCPIAEVSYPGHALHPPFSSLLKDSMLKTNPSRFTWQNFVVLFTTVLNSATLLLRCGRTTRTL